MYRSMPNRLSWLCGLSLFSVSWLLTHPAFAQAVSCESMGLDPTIEGERVLGRYYEASGGVGGLGCWVHAHPDGHDFVVTPFSWGQSPSPGKQGLIDETFEAIIDSRREMGRLGHLDTALYVLLHDEPRPDVGEARWIVAEECWIDVGPEAGYGAYGAERAQFRSNLAHEVGHCFLMENLEGFSPDTYTNQARWWDESGAEFLMAFVYPRFDAEHRTAIEFDLDGGTFDQAYKAHVLLQHYANVRGNEAVLPLLQEFHDKSGSADQFAAFLDRAGLDAFFHDFVVSHYGGNVNDPGGATLPRESVTEPFDRLRLDEDTGSFEVKEVLPYRLNEMELTIPKQRTVILEAPETVSTRFHASAYLFGEGDSNWAGGLRVEGLCEDESSFPLLLTTLRDEEVRDLTFKYRTEPMEDCLCDDAGSIDSCLVGSWEMDEASMSSLFGTEDPVAGRIEIAFFSGGAFVRTYSRVSYLSQSTYRSGKPKMLVEKGYMGSMRGCVQTPAAGRRPDGAAPLQAENVRDGVTRKTFIMHDGQRVTTNKTEAGLEAWFWPHKPAYYRCDDDELFIGRRRYERVGR